LSEHTIGILKGRFPWLRQIQMKLTEDTDSMKKILEYLEAAIILHNLLVDFDDDIPKEWIDTDEFSDIDDAERVPTYENFGLDREVPIDAKADERRRQLTAFFTNFFRFLTPHRHR
jgi:hypothetical protein